MPKTVIRFFRSEIEVVPILDWLSDLEIRDRQAYRKCHYLIDLLGDFGNELRRPRADYLRDGIYELRTIVGGINYRILYGFVGKNIAVVSHGITKKREVPKREIELAIKRLSLCHEDLERYSVEE